MKKAVLVILFSFVFIFSTFAARTNFYFDAGLGFGKGKTTWEGYEYRDYRGWDSSIKDIGIEAGARFGLAPVRKFPLFIVMDIDWAGHRFSDDYDNAIQFSTIMFGPGVVFYPNNIFQLSASAGLSMADYSESWSNVYIEYKTGFAWNVSAALDFGNSRNGFLLGVKYLVGTNNIVYWDSTASAYGTIEQKNSVFSIFARFALRRVF